MFCQGHHLTVELALHKLPMPAPAALLKLRGRFAELFGGDLGRHRRMSLNRESVQNPQSPASQQCAGRAGPQRAGPEAHPTRGGNSALHPLLSEEEKIYEQLFILKHLIPLQCLFWVFAIM